MRRGTIALIIIVVAVLAVGGYALFHNSNKTTPATASTNTSQSHAPAVNNAVLITKTDSKLGQYLADPSGMPLYTFGGDKNGASNCTGSCLAEWPAYIDKNSTTSLPQDVGTIKRTDNGQIQFTYNSRPLYFFVRDSVGKVTGDDEDDFHIAKPASSSNSSSSQSSTSLQYL